MKKILVLFMLIGLLFAGCNPNTTPDASESNHAGLPSADTSSRLDHLEISSVQFTFSSNMVLTADGDVYSWGTNALGVLGLGLEEDVTVQSPTKIEIGEPVTALWTCPNADTVLAMGESGAVYGWGGNHNRLLPGVEDMAVFSPVKLNIDIPVEDLSLSARFLTVWDAQGNAYECGWDLTGSMFYDDASEYAAVSSNILQPLTEKFSNPIRAYANSSLYRAVLDEQGQVYVKGRLAEGTALIYDEWTQIPCPERITKIGPLFQGMLCLTEGGKLYFVGEDRFDLLGSGEETRGIVYDPLTLVSKLDQEIADFEASTSSVIVRTVNNDFYTWGYRSGRTVAGSLLEYMAVPEQMDIPPDAVDYTCGEFYSAAIAEDGDIYVWGSDWYKQTTDIQDAFFHQGTSWVFTFDE